MRIVLINEYFPPYTPGGAEWSMFHMGRALAASGEEVKVITVNFGGCRDHEIIEGMSVFRIKIPFLKISNRGNLTTSHGFLKTIFLYFLFAAKMKTFLDSIIPDVIHCQNSYTIIPTLLASRHIKAKKILTIRDYSNICNVTLCPYAFEGQSCCHDMQTYFNKFHNSYLTYTKQGNKLHECYQFAKSTLEKIDITFRKRAIKKFDKVIFVSKKIRDIYIKAGVVNETQCAVVYNVPPIVKRENVFTQKQYGAFFEGKKLVLYAGKMSFGKGTEYLIRAIPRILESAPDTAFLLIGKGSENYSVPKGYEDRVKILPPVPNNELLSIMEKASIFVLPSIWQEPFSRTLLEAMSLGKPVVSTDTGGSPEAVLDGVTGLLVPPKNTPRLAESILKILNNEEMAQEMGRQGREFLQEHFNQEKSIRKLLSVYNGNE